jgi:hypothetical protein
MMDAIEVQLWTGDGSGRSAKTTVEAADDMLCLAIGLRDFACMGEDLAQARSVDVIRNGKVGAARVAEVLDWTSRHLAEVAAYEQAMR